MLKPPLDTLHYTVNSNLLSVVSYYTLYTHTVFLQLILAESCLSSLDCHGDEVDGFPATLSGCCVPGGGLSYREGSQCFNCYSKT